MCVAFIFNPFFAPSGIIRTPSVRETGKSHRATGKAYCRPCGLVVTFECFALLLVLVLEFESHVGPTFEFICQKTKESTVESALERGQEQFDASRRGKKGLRSSRDKNEDTCRGGEGGEGPSL